MSVLFKGHIYTVSSDPGTTRYHILILQMGPIARPLIHRNGKMRDGVPLNFPEAVMLDFQDDRLWMYDEEGKLRHRSAEKIAAVLEESQDDQEGREIFSPNTVDRKPNDERWREKSNLARQKILTLVGRKST